MKLIVDCDIGVDDAYAIMLASLTDNIELLALNVVSGNSTLENCAINTKLLLDKIYTKNPPPIYVGSTDKISIEENFTIGYHGFDGLAGIRDIHYNEEVLEIRKSWLTQSRSNAAIKLIEFVNQYPNEITIVALGPLTNLASAYRMSENPELFSKSIKNLVIMGGNELSNPYPPSHIEFNFAKDPISAKIVIEEFKCPITICPFEMTLRAFENVNLSVLHDKLEHFNSISAKCKYMHAIGFHRDENDEFKDYISCDFITTLIAIKENECKATFEYFENCEVDIDTYKGLLFVNKENSLKNSNNIKVIMDIDKSIVEYSIIECFEKLAKTD